MPSQPPTAPIPTTSAAPFVARPARLLIGWVNANVHAVLAESFRQQCDATTFASEVTAAQGIVASRPTYVQPPSVTLPLAQFGPHLLTLQRLQPGWALPAGTTIQMVDLTKLIPVQPHVFVDYANTQVAGLDLTNPLAIAGAALPLPGSKEIKTVHQSSNVMIVGSRDAQIRLTGQPYFGAHPTSPGLLLGFGLNYVSSNISVAHIQDRFILIDGTHRAHGFLKLGVNFVPAVVQDVAQFADLKLPPNVFQAAVVMGPRPPMLPDYQDNGVAQDVVLNFEEHLIIVSAVSVPAWVPDDLHP
jgi:hypothetical protein